MSHTTRIVSVLFAASLAVFASGCSMTVEALNPHPSVSVAGNAGKFAIDASKIPDDYDPGRGVHIHQFRTTLGNALKNAVGNERFSDSADGANKLVFSEMSMSFSNIGQVGSYVLIRFRAKWVAPDGQVISEASGTAEPINPTETGERHLEDAVEVMFGKLVEGFDRATTGGRKG